MFAPPWFLTAFAGSLPLEAALRVLDLLFLDGLPALFRVGIALLAGNEDHLLRQDFDGVLHFFSRRGLADAYPPARAAAPATAAARVRLSERRLLALEKDYAAHRRAEGERASCEARLRAEVAALHAANAALSKRVLALEAESAALAARMLAQSVAAHEREEELYELRLQFGLIPPETPRRGALSPG